MLSLLISTLSFSSTCVEDRAGVSKILEEYRKAWLANDEERVMKTFSHDAILMPANSKKTVEGGKAIQEYWWPAGSPFTIDQFDQPLLEIISCGDLGYVRGTSRVAWTSTNNGVKTKSESTSDFVAIVKRDQGSWLITRLIWYQTN